VSLHHPSNRFEDISIYWPLFNSVTKKLFLGRKNIGGYLPPVAPTQVTAVVVLMLLLPEG
jgi:hypothetical protein